MKQVRRTFVGIPIFPDADFLEDIERIKTWFSHERIKWSDPSNFHITLHFFGDTMNEDIPVISKILDESTAAFHRFAFRISGIGFFRNVNHPRVLWLGINGIQDMEIFREHFEHCLESHGFLREDRPFRPHLTLGRLKKLTDPSAGDIIGKYANHDFLKAEASEVIYFESVMTQKGAVYQPLSRHRLPVV